MGTSPFSVLERVELAAREQRLVAAAQADAILAAARARADEIQRRLPERAAVVAREVREAHARQAEIEIAAMEAELQALERPPAGDSQRAIDDAAGLIVAAVLGEDVPPAQPDAPAGRPLGRLAEAQAVMGGR